VRALVALAVAACHATPTPAPTPAPAPVPIADAAPDAAPIAHHDVGRLAADPAGELWPTRVCVEGNTLVFEHFCGCNDALLCTITAAGSTLAVALRKDPSRTPMCLDCFPMVPARCALPTPAAAWNVTINGHPAFALPIDRADGGCWASPP